MRELTRTLVFVVVALVCVAAAGLTGRLTRLPAPEGFDLVGENFYPAADDPTRSKYDDPNVATALRVVSFDAETAAAQVFQVEYRDGAWRLPSFHDYPAEAADQLATTAASVFSVSRGALVSRRKADHENYGVVDPLDDGTQTLKGRGRRVTLFKGDEELVDFVIGRKVEDRDDQYYVRRGDEDDVYVARIDLSLSTKFSEWIEPDLLGLERNELAAMEIHRPVVGPEGEFVDEVLRLSRTGSTEPWTLEGLDEQEEQVDADRARRMVDALDDLRIVGVRPKPAGITPDFYLDPPPEIDDIQDPQLRRQQLAIFSGLLLDELESRGFTLAAGPDGEPRLLSREGEVVAATDRGVACHLHFGRLFTGTEEEIQIGRDEKPGDEAEPPVSSDQNRSRYLFVRAEFDPKYIGEKPTPPVAPEKPAGIDEQPPESAPPDADESDADEPDAETSDAGPPQADDSDAADSDAGAANAPNDGDEDPQAKAKAEFEQAPQAEYERNRIAYEAALAAYEQKVADGKQKVEELNDRFGEWYYVISAASFDDLSVPRKDLVKPKEKEENAADDEQPQSPGTDPPPARNEPSNADDAKDPDAPNDAAPPNASAEKSPGDDGDS